MTLDEQIKAQQRQIHSALSAGATHLVKQSGGGSYRVHTLTCEWVHRLLDRLAEWDTNPNSSLTMPIWLRIW